MDVNMLYYILGHDITLNAGHNIFLWTVLSFFCLPFSSVILITSHDLPGVLPYIHQLYDFMDHYSS